MKAVEIDEAFAPLRDNVAGYTGLGAAGRIEEQLGEGLARLMRTAGARFEVESIDVETPIELDVLVDADGGVRLGCAPPLYRVETGILPVFHQLRMTIAPEHQLLTPSADEAMRTEHGDEHAAQR